MKIKGKLIIPLVAIMIAMFTLGITPGSAVDTTVSTTDPLSYVAPTVAPTSSLEEQVGGFISDAFGNDLQSAGTSFRGISEAMEEFILNFRNIFTTLISLLEKAGDFMGNGDLLGNLGGLLG